MSRPCVAYNVASNSNTRSAGVVLLVIAILAFTVMRAIVPAGYMPSDGSTSSWFMLCYGDSLSRQVIAVTDPHHGHHSMGESASQGGASGEHALHELGKQHAQQGVCTYAAQVVVYAMLLFALVFILCVQRLNGAYLYHYFTARCARFVWPVTRAPPCYFIA